MLKIYPAIFTKEEGSFWVTFPDLEGCNTFGSSLEEAMEMAQEALGLYLVSIEEDGHRIPTPSDIKNITAEGDVVSYVSTDVTKYKKSTKAVKKTVSIPEWLATEAEKKNISLSKVLQEGLKDQIV